MMMSYSSRRCISENEFIDSTLIKWVLRHFSYDQRPFPSYRLNCNTEIEYFGTFHWNMLLLLLLLLTDAGMDIGRGTIAV